MSATDDASATASRRLHAISKGVATINDTTATLLVVLPDLAPVHLTGNGTTTISINNAPVLSYTLSPAQTFQHLTSAVGTKHETKAAHVPAYPLITLVGTREVSIEDFWGCVYALHYIYHEQEMIPILIDWSVPNAPVLREYALHSGLAVLPKSKYQPNTTNQNTTVNVLFFLRSSLYQNAGTTSYHTRGFLRSQALSPFGYPPASPYPLSTDFTRTELSITSHPKRAAKPRPGEIVYRRWAREVGRMISFVAVDFGQGKTQSQRSTGESESPKAGEAEAEADPTPHLLAYHGWHNSPHVARAWGHAGSLSFHKRYLQRMYDNHPWLAGGTHLSSLDPKSKLYEEEKSKEEANPGGGAIGFVMMWDDEMMGWAEITWVMENHLGTHIPDGGVRAYDRGLHLLVGEKKFAGPDFSRGWFNSVLHMLFLFDPRTERVLGEPNAGNEAIMTASLRGGMHSHGIFDFPYKRSAITYLPRHRFFQMDLL